MSAAAATLSHALARKRLPPRYGGRSPQKGKRAPPRQGGAPRRPPAGGRAPPPQQDPALHPDLVAFFTGC